jgi:hypothetical protein
MRYVRFGFGLVGLLVGAACGLILHDTDSSTRSLRPATVPSLPRHVLVDNERPLTAAGKSDLTNWLERWRRCMARNDIELPAPEGHGNEIVLKLPAKYAGQPPPPSYLRASFECGDALGGPPTGSALVVRAGVEHLYKPRACLLPVKEAT